MKSLQNQRTEIKQDQPIIRMEFLTKILKILVTAQSMLLIIRKLE